MCSGARMAHASIGLPRLHSREQQRRRRLVHGVDVEASPRCTKAASAAQAALAAVASVHALVSHWRFGSAIAQSAGVVVTTSKRSRLPDCRTPARGCPARATTPASAGPLSAQAPQLVAVHQRADFMTLRPGLPLSKCHAFHAGVASTPGADVRHRQKRSAAGRVRCSGSCSFFNLGELHDLAVLVDLAGDALSVSRWAKPPPSLWLRASCGIPGDCSASVNALRSLSWTGLGRLAGAIRGKPHANVHVLELGRDSARGGNVGRDERLASVVPGPSPAAFDVRQTRWRARTRQTPVVAHQVVGERRHAAVGMCVMNSFALALPGIRPPGAAMCPRPSCRSCTCRGSC